jgi:uncharacterized protein YbjT (DUF2867 family)
MSEKKIIAVVGATGAQGGGLVRAILNDPSGGFAARAITRNAGSDKAQALAKTGAEVVAADVDDVESLKKVFNEAYAAFCVTFFWEHMSPEKEKQHAKNMVEAAKQAGVKHVIWSSLDDTRNWVPLSDDRMPTLMNEYKVPHFDAKGEANKYFTESGVPTTILNTVFYWDNFIYFGLGPKKGPDGKLALTFPMADKKFPAIAAEDIGKCAYGIFKNGEKYIRKTVGIAGGHLTGEQMAKGFSDALGKEVVYNPVTPEMFRGFGFPGAEDMGNMFQFKQEFEEDYCNSRSIDLARTLNPSLQTFGEWIDKNKNLVPLE